VRLVYYKLRCVKTLQSGILGNHSGKESPGKRQPYRRSCGLHSRHLERGQRTKAVPALRNHKTSIGLPDMWNSDLGRKTGGQTFFRLFTPARPQGSTPYLVGLSGNFGRLALLHTAA
jgi:hypothetical protein